MLSKKPKSIEEWVELSVKEVLAWSDKHRSLGDGEGVRVVHIKQLLTQALTSHGKQEYKRGFKDGRKDDI